MLISFSVSFKFFPSLEKFLEFNHTQRGISVRGLLSEINQVNDAYERLISSKDFDWELVPKI